MRGCITIAKSYSLSRLQVYDSQDGEMSEWLKEHAWKAKRASDVEPLGGTLTHTRFAARPSRTITRCASVNLGVLRGFEPDVSQSYHNRVAYLPRVATYVLVLVQTDTSTRRAKTPEPNSSGGATRDIGDAHALAPPKQNRECHHNSEDDKPSYALLVVRVEGSA
jgi:hypothetical protein